MNGNIILNDSAPRWLRYAIYIVQHVGFPIVVSGILLAVFLGWVTSPLTETQAGVKEHAAITTVHQSEMNRLIAELIGAQRATCLALSRTEDARRLCVQ